MILSHYGIFLAVLIQSVCILKLLLYAEGDKNNWVLGGYVTWEEFNENFAIMRILKAHTHMFCVFGPFFFFFFFFNNPGAFDLCKTDSSKTIANVVEVCIFFRVVCKTMFLHNYRMALLNVNAERADHRRRRRNWALGAGFGTCIKRFGGQKRFGSNVSWFWYEIRSFLRFGTVITRRLI